MFSFFYSLRYLASIKNKRRNKIETFFKALSDRTRLEILLLIALNPDICLCHIEECFNLSNSNLSRHLKELENANLITAYKVGKWKHYSVSDAGIEFVTFIKHIDNQQLFMQVKNKKHSVE